MRDLGPKPCTMKRYGTSRQEDRSAGGQPLRRPGGLVPSAAIDGSGRGGGGNAPLYIRSPLSAERGTSGPPSLRFQPTARGESPLVVALWTPIRIVAAGRTSLDFAFANPNGVQMLDGAPELKLTKVRLYVIEHSSVNDHLSIITRTERVVVGGVKRMLRIETRVEEQIAVVPAHCSVGR